MRLDHRAGCDSGVDYTTVVVFTIWIAMTIVLVVLAVLRSNAVETRGNTQAGLSCLPLQRQV